VGKKEKNVETQRMSIGDLPEGWVISTLGEISTKPQYGWTTKANHESGNVKLLRTTDITSGQINWATVPYCSKKPDDLDKYLLEPGDIVISRAGSVGVSYLLTDTDNAVFASYLIRFRPNEPVDKKYVYYYLKSPDYWKAIGKSTLGIAVPNVNATKLAKVKIPIAPENEQKRIVAEIEKQFSRLDEAVENLKRVKANLKRYKASVLKAAVEGKLTEEWRKKHPNVEPADKLLQRILAERRKKWEEAELAKIRVRGKQSKDDKWKKKYKEPAVPLLSALPNVPNGWEFAGIEQLLPPEKEAMKTGPFGSLLKKHEHRPEGIPVLGIENIQAMEFVPGSKIHITKKKAEELNGYSVASGDILISRSGTVGEVCVVPGNIGQARISTNLMKISLAKDGMSSEFFTFLFNGSPFVLSQVSELCKGSTREFLNQDILKRLVFILPPVEEQKLIIQEVDQRFTIISGIERELARNLRRAERLRQSILKKAFSGQLVS